MIELPTSSLLPASISYQAFASAYLPHASHVGIVTAAQQKQLLSEMDSQVRKEKFYFISDVATGDISFCKGVQHWLGHQDKAFTLKKLISLLHPVHVTPLAFYAAALYLGLPGIKCRPDPAKPLLSATLSLKAYDEKFWYCKRDIYPYQYDTDNRMMALLHEVTLIKKYEGELPSLRLIMGAKNDSIHFSQKLKELFMKHGGFSPQEHRMLQRYAHSEKVSSEAIARAFKIGKTTVNTYNKRILKKAEAISLQRFENAKLAALYLKKLDLI